MKTTRLKNNPNLKVRRRELRKRQTDVEIKLWSQLRSKQMLGLKFFRQYSIGPYILDIYCPAKRLAIELDGGQHIQTIFYDNKRTDFLQNHGIQVIRYWDNEVLTNIDEVLESIRQKLEE